MFTSSTLIILSLFQTQAPPSTVAAIEEAARNQRLAIRTATIRLKYSSEKNGQVSESERRIWVDGSHIRCDVIRGKNTSIPGRTIECHNCEKPGHHVFYRRPEAEKGKNVQVVALTRTKPHDSQRVVIDPRLLGLGPCALGGLRDHNFYTILGRPNRSAPTLKRDIWKGHECWLIEFTSYETLFRVWICPKMDHSVIRIVADWEFAGNKRQNSVESELEQFGSSKIWFPKTVTYKRIEGEKEVEVETTSVVEASLNEPVPGEVFTLAGMDLEENTPVSGPDGKGVALLWNGTSLVAFSQPEFLPEPILDNDGQRSGWLRILAYALAAVALPAISFVVYRRRIAHGT